MMRNGNNINMNNLSNYIVEKLKLDKTIGKQGLPAKKEKDNFADYYLVFYERPTRELHAKWLGAYSKGSDGRAEAEKEAKKYSNFGYSSWKPLGVKKRFQLNNIPKVDKMNFY